MPICITKPPPHPVTCVDLPGLPNDPDEAARLLDDLLAARRARPDADVLGLWDEIVKRKV